MTKAQELKSLAEEFAWKSMSISDAPVARDKLHAAIDALFSPDVGACDERNQMKALSMAVVVGFLVFGICMWVGWMHGLDFSERGKDTGFTAVVSVLLGFASGVFVFLNCAERPTP